MLVYQRVKKQLHNASHEHLEHIPQGTSSTMDASSVDDARGNHHEDIHHSHARSPTAETR